MQLKGGVNMDRKLLYYVNFNENSEIEGRIFYDNEDYPVYEKDGKYVILCAENGEFCFSKELMNKAVDEWELVIRNI